MAFSKSFYKVGIASCAPIATSPVSIISPSCRYCTSVGAQMQYLRDGIPATHHLHCGVVILPMTSDRTHAVEHTIARYHNQLDELDQARFYGFWIYETQSSSGSISSGARSLQTLLWQRGTLALKSGNVKLTCYVGLQRQRRRLQNVQDHIPVFSTTAIVLNIDAQLSTAL
jgi:hypothetical protein